MDIFTIVTWILFLGMIGLAFYWLRKAWKIGIKKDYTYVALKRGLPPENPQKYAKAALLINLIPGLILVVNILLIIVIGLSYDIWTAIIGNVLWIKVIAEFILSRQAHLKKK